jgi:hypothetical protein
LDVNKSKGAIGSLIAVVILGLFLYWLAGKLGDLRDARLCRGVPEAMLPPKSGSALGRALSIDSYMPMQVGLSRSLVLSAVCSAMLFVLRLLHTISRVLFWHLPHRSMCSPPARFPPLPRRRPTAPTASRKRCKCRRSRREGE